MFAATDTAWAPWYIARTDDKKSERYREVAASRANARARRVPDRIGNRASHGHPWTDAVT
jgi:hypothetical protein